MTKEEFEPLFNTLMSNKWRFPGKGDDATIDLYYTKLKDYNPNDVLDVFLQSMDREEQKTPPSIGEVKSSLRNIIESRKIRQESIERKSEKTKTTKHLLTRCVAEAREIINSNSKKEGFLFSVSAEGKKKLKECGIKYRNLAINERVTVYQP